MKRQSRILYCFLILAASLAAQYNTSFLNYRYTGRSVGVNLDFEAGSNGMSNRLVNKMIFGGYINNQLKEESSRHLKSRNNFGLLLNYDMTAVVKGRKNFDLLIGAKNQEVLNATYSSDFFNLMFYGNKRYMGKYADLSNCNVNALRFQEVKIGAILNEVDSIAKIGVAVSVLKGEQLFYIKTFNNSNLYTSADGSSVLFNSNFSMALSDTSKRGPLNFNGIGASADLFFETTYTSRGGKKCLLTVSANNIGFIHWWKNSVQYSSDSSLNFSGYTVRDITDLKDSTISRINGDSLLRNLSNARREDFNVNIPTNLVLLNRIKFNQRFVLATGFRYIFNANYRPYFFAEPEFHKNNVIYTLHTGYGGYVKLNVGVSVTWSKPRWFFRIGSNSLQGYLFPKSAFGQAVFISFAKKLR